MYVYCLNSPSNLYDPDGRCSRFLGFLWKVDCNSPTCSTSKSYIKPSPPVESIGTYNDSNGNPIGKVYIIQGSQLEDMNRSKEATDVVIIDKRTESKPAMQVQNSYAISNKEYQRQICQLMVNYNTNNPVDPAWYRTVDSMLIEWKAHNDGYKARVLIGLFKDNAAERLMHVDFDNDAEGTPYWGFLGK